MSSIEKLKTEAVALAEKARAGGLNLKHCNALEQVARRHGYGSWRACRAAQAKAAPAPQVEMRRYTNHEWNFSLDVPKRWNVFPPVPPNSPHEVIRFASLEDRYHLLTVFRMAADPARSVEARFASMRQHLEKAGYSNFVESEIFIRSRQVLVTDFEQLLEDGLWSCRIYSFVADRLGYTLGFGTFGRTEARLALFDRMARSFEFSRV